MCVKCKFYFNGFYSFSIRQNMKLIFLFLKILLRITVLEIQLNALQNKI